jgi:hypothetical protein
MHAKRKAAMKYFKFLGDRTKTVMKNAINANLITLSVKIFQDVLKSYENGISTIKQMKNRMRYFWRGFSRPLGFEKIAITVSSAA